MLNTETGYIQLNSLQVSFACI
uniref:Uncharacterized protein n=1 Tax=Rhizophora mucronata TaxID=61149 RepID=A0A2P2QQ60_RHIMU